jgi:hypothetical protein
MKVKTKVRAGLALNTSVLSASRCSGVIATPIFAKPIVAM